jgi:hypothetical protein
MLSKYFVCQNTLWDNNAGCIAVLEMLTKSESFAEEENKIGKRKGQSICNLAKVFTNLTLNFSFCNLLACFAGITLVALHCWTIKHILEIEGNFTPHWLRVLLSVIYF